ncbi:MAG: class I SAM-dependent methyltransferase [Lentisphaerae bacterium]|nr:class I SAM-dependent methyltransferase [Lentisphaerota bacterium]
MEYVCCNLCGVDDTLFLFLAKDRNSKAQRLFRIVQCRRCGLVYLNPRPDQEEIKGYYPPWYHDRARAGITDIEETTAWGITWRELMRKKAAPLLKRKTQGRILDIGCGDGSLLKYLQGLGWQTYGVEFNDVPAKYAREVLGLNVFAGRLEEAHYPEGAFDVITLFHALEHLPDPRQTLERTFTLLDQKGLLVIEAPNFASLEARIFRSKWCKVTAPLHFYHFTPPTLRLLLKNSGFALQQLRCIPPHIKYVSEYSESLRYCLLDLGLYPRGEQWMEAMRRESSAGFTKPAWGGPLHFMEYLIFYSLAYCMAKIGRGSTMLALATKAP